MKKNLDSLVNKFKLIEKELIEILNEKPVDFESIENKTQVKKALKDYIKKVNKAKKLFAEYEKIAKEIDDISSDEGDSQELTLESLEQNTIGVSKLQVQSLGAESEILSNEKLQKNAKIKSKTKASVKEF